MAISARVRLPDGFSPEVAASTTPFATRVAAALRAQSATEAPSGKLSSSACVALGEVRAQRVESAVQEGEALLPGERVVRREQAFGLALGYPVGDGPGHGVGVIRIRGHVVKDRQSS